jgi:hypothetical protein
LGDKFVAGGDVGYNRHSSGIDKNEEVIIGIAKGNGKDLYI